MQQVDLAYLFTAGSSLRSIHNLDETQSPLRQFVLLEATSTAIKTLIFSSVYTGYFRPALVHASNKFTQKIQALMDKTYPINGGEVQQLSAFEISLILSDFSRFEAVLESELQSISAYTIRRKGGFETSMMVETGEVFFPGSLGEKVPEALTDVQEAMRCLAFEVWTAAGFHFHRANETVLRIYWDSVSKGKPRPKNGNMGVYLKELRKLEFGKESTLNQLQSLKDFHRNPLMHPEQSLETLDDALDLMAAVRCSIGYMLSEIT